MVLANHLREIAPVGLDGREALRMANAEYLNNEQRTCMTRSAVEIAMRELMRSTTKAA